MSLIVWQEWGEMAFDQARRQDKPVLLDIGAVWCHWCHVMDTGIPGDQVHTGTYSDPAVANLINESYIPIKVDNDRRPDINARYNMGGWPTTAFLTPDGDLIYGETYVPPGRMLSLLRYIAESYRNKKPEIAKRIADRVKESDLPQSGTERVSNVPEQAPDYVVSELADHYDPTYGGFGQQPKFPQCAVLRFALNLAARGDQEMVDIVKTTLIQMAGGGMYDRHAGGFFRYSTTRDWNIPHYEKMLEDNAQLSDLCMRAGYLFDDEELVQVGIDVHRWLFSTMLDPATGCFAGSQDADKEEGYYGKSLQERKVMPTPYIDRTIYAGWNALAVCSLATRYRVGGDPEVLDTARRAYAFITHNVLGSHYWADGHAQGAKDLLGDLTSAIRAAIDLWEITGEPDYLTDAARFAQTLINELEDDQGGFFDIKPEAGAIGELARPKKEIVENAEAALALINLSICSGDQRYRAAAERALCAFGESYERWSYFAAPYASAVQAALEPQISVVLTGTRDDERLRGLRRAAWLAPRDTVTCRIVAGGNEAEYPPDPDGRPLAYVCIGTTCSAPVSTEKELSALLR